MAHIYLVIPIAHSKTTPDQLDRHKILLKRTLLSGDSPRTAMMFLVSRLVELLAHLSKQPPEVIGIDPTTGDIFSIPGMHPLSHRDLFSRDSSIFLANASYLLETQQPYAEVIGMAHSSKLAIYRLGKALLCCAVYLEWLDVCDDRIQDFRNILIQLVAQIDTVAPISWASVPGASEVLPDNGNLPMAPSAADFPSVAMRDAPTAPIYLNTAFAELVDEATNDIPGDCGPEHLRQVFLAMRAQSSVLWIFNALVNTIEYRSGISTVDGFPTEVHLALTGACNIACTFCSYTHQIFERCFVSLAQVAHLDFLGYLMSLRLSSGLGEPTLDPHLPQIIEWLAHTYPHLGLNLFTNGITLGKNDLLNALIGRVRWINVSLNAATSSTWRDLCGQDLFARVCENLRTLHDCKRKHGVLFPIAHASMVLTKRNLSELPRMPALCRSLGIDRFTGFPFAAFNAQTKDGDADTFHLACANYDVIYAKTIREAQEHRVSVEIPLPERATQIAFGLELRAFYDFAGIESHHNPLALLVDNLNYKREGSAACPALWQTASISATAKTHAAGSGKHFLYPCLGPLGSLDLSRQTRFNFPDALEFLHLWNNPIYVKLRQAQHHPGGQVTVCDVCRCKDSRDPSNFAELSRLVVEWMAHNGIPTTG
ncbi:MAG: radical SAM protein [Gammaproteobacteria bacterium]|nr:radical SAM protein [Gammaproteobacteria bacterium]